MIWVGQESEVRAWPTCHSSMQNLWDNGRLALNVLIPPLGYLCLIIGVKLCGNGQKLCGKWTRDIPFVSRILFRVIAICQAAKEMAKDICSLSFPSRIHDSRNRFKILYLYLKTAKRKRVENSKCISNLTQRWMRQKRYKQVGKVKQNGKFPILSCYTLHSPVYKVQTIGYGLYIDNDEPKSSRFF